MRTHLNKHASILCYATACSAHKPDWEGGSWGEELTIRWEASTANHGNSWSGIQKKDTGQVRSGQLSLWGHYLSNLFYEAKWGSKTQYWQEFSEEAEGGYVEGVLCLHEYSESR